MVVMIGEIQWVSANEQAATEPKKKAPTSNEIVAEAVSRTSLDITGRPTFLLTLDQAAELAMFNSREYQDRRENLFLAALPVTQERFSFTSQLFAATEGIRGASGREFTSTTNLSWWTSTCQPPRCLRAHATCP